MSKFLIRLLVVTGFCYAAGAALAQMPNAPTGVTAAWSSGPGSNRTVSLTWLDHATNETAYAVERRIGAGAWTEIAASLAANTQSYQDTTVPGSSAVNTNYFYRIRAKNGTTKSGAGEVCTAGITSTEVYDTDADGMTDAEEATHSFNPTDWTDGTADFDGDGVPNTWEVRLGKDPKATSSTEYDSAAITALNTGVMKWVTVDPSQPVAGNNVATITAALAKFPSGTSHTFESYRVIKVKPGVYTETVNKAIYANVAILADRSQLSDVFEIRNAVAAPTATTLTTVGSLVVDGFTLGRSSGTAKIVQVSDDATSTNRISQVRLVNCMISNSNSGADSLVEQTRSRLILAHCTFYMNGCASNALAHSYSTGPLTTTTPVESTARLKVINSIFWNPLDTSVPEFQSVGDHEFTTSIVFQSTLAGMPLIPAGAEHINPGLTPKGFVASASSPAASGGTVNQHVVRDIHGEVRFNPTGRGADEWDDEGDGDGVPTFVDTNPNSSANAFWDNDGDQLSELMEYLGSTDQFNADSAYLALTEIFFTKAESENLFYTKTESDARYLTEVELDADYLRRDEVLRVQPQGGLSMGEFTNGSLP